MDVKDDEFKPEEDLREQAEHEYKLSDKQKRMMSYIKQDIPITEIAKHLTEDYWLQEILKDTTSEDKFVRTQALRMLGQYMGILNVKGKVADNRRIDVEFKGE